MIQAEGRMVNNPQGREPLRVVKVVKPTVSTSCTEQESVHVPFISQAVSNLYSHWSFLEDRYVVQAPTC